jgi:hypothetical protein
MLRGGHQEVRANRRDFTGSEITRHFRNLCAEDRSLRTLKQLLQGAALGAFATPGIGFSWGGFMLGITAKTLADSMASSAVVAAVAPICVDQFQHSADAANNLTALKKTSTWEQATALSRQR